MRRGVAAFLALSAAATGCGGSEPLTRAEYVAQADAVCRDVAGRWAELEPPVPEGPVDEDEFAEMMAWDMATGRDLGGEVLDRVGDLQPPASIEDRSDEMLEALGQIVDDLDAYAAAVESRNEAELERLSDTVDDRNQEVFQRHAEALGLTSCGKGLFLSSWRATSAPDATQPELELDQPAPSSTPSRSGAGR